ncbi:MAG: hypothetical protein ACRCV7_00325 [Culicoidibacterales bacterium]
MKKIVETLGVSWGVGSLIHEYLTGSAWWAWMIDAGFLVAGIVSGGVAALMKQAVKLGLKQAIKHLSKGAAIKL